LDWEAPTNVKEIRGFLGMAGYYRRFIEGFSKIAGPMTKLLRKNTVGGMTPGRVKRLERYRDYG
jgi:hypothetical protein